MKAIAEVRVPAAEAGFEATFEALPAFHFEMKQVVESERGSVTPPVWVGGASREDVEAAFESDPTVESFTLVSSEDDRWLYRVEWASQMSILTDIFLMNGGTLLDAFGYDGEWWFRLLYTDAETFAETLTDCRKRDVTVDVDRVVELADETDADGGDAGGAVDSHPAIADASADVVRVTDSDGVADALELDAGPFAEGRWESPHATLELHIGQADPQEEVG